MSVGWTHLARMCREILIGFQSCGSMGSPLILWCVQPSYEGTVPSDKACSYIGSCLELWGGRDAPSQVAESQCMLQRIP